VVGDDAVAGQMGGDPPGRRGCGVPAAMMRRAVGLTVPVVPRPTALVDSEVKGVPAV
jgi:hypothetical protein